MEANVNILTCLLFLKKKTRREIQAEDMGDPVFMAVAEKVGFDRRGNKLYVRNGEGVEILTPGVGPEKSYEDGRTVVPTFRTFERTVDNDLPKIAAAYRAFRQENPEPGLTRPKEPEQ